MQPCKQRNSFAARTERRIAIEQALFVGAANHGAEAEVFEFLRRSC